MWPGSRLRSSSSEVREMTEPVGLLGLPRKIRRFFFVMAFKTPATSKEKVSGPREMSMTVAPASWAKEARGLAREAGSDDPRQRGKPTAERSEALPAVDDGFEGPGDGRER